MPVGMPPRAATLPLLVVQGDWNEAQELVMVTRVQGSPLERQMATMLAGYLAHHQGDVDTAWAMVQELLPRGPDSEPDDGLFPYAIEVLRLAVSLSLDAGDSHSASEWLRAHDRWLHWSGAIRGQAESHLLHAHLYILLQEHNRAAAHAQSALDCASEPRQPLMLVKTFRTLGEIAMNTRSYEDAESYVRKSLSLARACAAPYERARTLVSLGNLYVMTNRSQQIVPILNEIRSIASNLNATPLTADADELEAKLPTENMNLADLTSREQEVLRLVAQGLTDSQVAELLFISPRTVGQHLRSIYNKLDVSSRTSATRFAVENHLI